MRLEVIKDYGDEISIAVIMPWPYKENPLNWDGIIYNKTVSIDLYYRLFNAVQSKDYGKVQGILNRNRFAKREYKQGITTLYI